MELACVPAYAYWQCSEHVFEPFEPTCISALGDTHFRSEWEFQQCCCEVRDYAATMDRWLACAAANREQQALAYYNALARLYNCRLEGHGDCGAAPGAVVFGTHDLLPWPPFCLARPADRGFGGTFEAELCRRDVEKLQGELLVWIEREGAEDRRRATQKVDDVVRRFNCRARGERFCL